MAKEPTKANLPALPVELVNIAVTLDKDDVAAILMSRAEEHLKGMIKACQKCETKLKAEAKTLASNLEAQLKVVAAEHFESTIDILKSAAEGLKVRDFKATTEACSHSVKKNGHSVVHCGLSVKGNRPVIVWSVRQDAKMPAAVKTILADQAKNVENYELNQESWMSTRRKLADLPTLERRAKAAVAEQRLKASDEGIALVKMLDDQLDSSIALLGVG